jgi:membrane protein YqaA with SNARE-associated domain
MSSLWQGRGQPRYIGLLRHLGAFGLFMLAVADSSPIPTFAGTDILTVVLSASHRNPWYEYAAVATAGSVLGAYITFRAARRAGSAYLERRFGKRRVAGFLKTFEKWGTAGLVFSSAVPFPSPTSAFFAAAGVLKYPVPPFIAVVTVSRAVRYTTVALLAWYYGRHLIYVLKHPGQYALWLLGIAVGIVILGVVAVLLRRAIESS